jgi:hypothetical protein
MITLSWTGLVNDGAGPPVDRHTLWNSLLEKAENPLDYVPAITACEVLERYDDGFLRRIVRDGRTLLQRVVPEPESRIVFHHLDDPDVASITNVVGEDADGALTFTIEVRLASTGAATALGQSPFLLATDEYFTGTLDAILGALRPLAAASARGGSR